MPHPAATRCAFAALAVSAIAATAVSAQPQATAAADRDQSTQRISRALDGGMPDGASINPVISMDKRYTRAIAFESDATNLVSGDVNGFRDVFVVNRGGRVDNVGSPWRPGTTRLVSRTFDGAPSDGPSYGASISGGFHARPSCIGFVSRATNIVPGDTNGVADAFVGGVAGGAPKRISLPGGRQVVKKVTKVAVSNDCRRYAFVSGGRLYSVGRSGRPRRLRAPGRASNPSFSVGLRNDLVFAATRGVYLSRGGTRRPKLVARGGRNPVFNDVKRQTLAYEKRRGGREQIAYRDLGGRERIISRRGGAAGNRDSRDPVIGNSGYYVTFESDATNLGVNALSRVGDHNGRPDSYLFTDVRDLTLVQSVEEKAEPLPGGGENPGMSFYANYIVFDSPGPLGARDGAHQIFMRYLGPV